LLTGTITQLVLAIISKDTRMPFERWMFDINLVQTEGDSEGPDAKWVRCTVVPDRPLITASITRDAVSTIPEEVVQAEIRTEPSP
jgi:hypothetical protein